MAAIWIYAPPPVITLSATGTAENGKPTHYISLINTGNVLLTASVNPNEVLTWTGATPTDNLHGTVSTATPGNTQVTVSAGGASATVTIHVVDATSPPVPTPAVLTHVNAGGIPMASFAQFNAFGVSIEGGNPQFAAPFPIFTANAYFSGNQWVFRLASVTGFYSEGWLAPGSPGPPPNNGALIDLPVGNVVPFPQPPNFNLAQSEAQAQADLNTAGLVPFGPGVGGPPRNFYYVQNITQAHEDFHVNDFYTNFWPQQMATFQNTDVEAGNVVVVYDCNNAATTTGPGAISIQTPTWNGQIDNLHTATYQNFNNLANDGGPESRAHTFTNPMYVPIWNAIP